MPRTGSAPPLPPLGSPHTRLRLAQVVVVVVIVVVVVVVVVQTNSQPQNKRTWRNKCTSKTQQDEGLNRTQHPMEIASTSLENGGGSRLCWTSTCSAGETIVDLQIFGWSSSTFLIGIESMTLKLILQMALLFRGTLTSPVSRFESLCTDTFS